MSQFKNLELDDILISPFQVNKTFSVTNYDSGSGVYAISITKGTDSNLYGFEPSTSTSQTISSNVFYNVPTYYGINTTYYRDITSMAGYIDFINGIPKNHPTAGVIEYRKTRFLYDTPNRPSSIKLIRPYTRQLHDTANIISVPQVLFGESISKKSVRLVDNDASPQIILEDDGFGNLYDVAFSSSYSNREPDSNDSGSVVGNIFYDDGLFVITDTGSYSEVGAGNFTLTFDSTQTIYEREYICRTDENEFRHTTNRSLKLGYSSSIEFHGTEFSKDPLTNTRDDKFSYDTIGFATGAFQNQNYQIGKELIGEATHSHFATYITSIGLYNNNNELIAIAKTAKPIKNEKEMSLSFVVRFDTN
tara:strand:+ start:698 stop:1783 length:1086 start_codon:yes stop_codon:yes gene_type:complete